jgi:hypothetical protein
VVGVVTCNLQARDVMFVPRTIRTSSDWDVDGTKIYTISKDGGAVEQGAFRARLDEIKASRAVAWSQTPHFAIFHRGAIDYLIVCWWGNDNELFTSVSVLVDDGWVEQPERYSFCLFDLEVFWDERNAYIDTIYCARPSLSAYRQRRRQGWMEPIAA